MPKYPAPRHISTENQREAEHERDRALSDLERVEHERDRALALNERLLAAIATDRGCDHCFVISEHLACTNPCPMQAVRTLIGGARD